MPSRRCRAQARSRYGSKHGATTVTAILVVFGLAILMIFKGYDPSVITAVVVEARDFCRWLLVAGKPTRLHWRHQGEASTVSVRAGRRSGAEPYAVSVRAHSETVLRSFYDFHCDAGTGPMVNPFPLDRARRSRGACAAHCPAAT